MKPSPTPSPSAAELTGQHDRVGLSPTISVGLVAVTAVAGGGALAVLPQAAERLLGLPWVPLGGPLRLVTEVDGHVAWWVLALAGVVVGVLVGLALVDQTTVVTVGDREIVITEGRRRIRLARSQVHQVVLEGRRLSLRDEHDVDLASQAVDGEPAELTAALRRHGWPL